jgi:hypothetical protein
MSKGEKPILSVRIDQQLMERIDALCDRTGVGRADIVERCVMVGLADEEQFVQWLESPVKGELINWLTHPQFVKLIIKLVGGGFEVDETQQRVKENLRSRARAKVSRKAVRE